MTTAEKNKMFPRAADPDVSEVSLLLKRGSQERLKREIAVAVYDWETRLGLPHYDADWREQIHCEFEAAKARNGKKKRVAKNFALTVANGNTK